MTALEGVRIADFCWLWAGAYATDLLAFLGAGVTHNRAPKNPPELAGYQEVVRKGLVYLSRNQRRTNDNQDGYLGGNMYANRWLVKAPCLLFP